MHKEAKDKHFIKQPVYPGGPSAMKQFIGGQLRYPPEALENGIEGTVSLKYDIDHQGNVVDAKVVSGLGHGCDEEALRLVKLLKFKVEKPRGVRVLYHKNIQIHFRLPKAGEGASIQYTYVPAAPKKEGNPPDKPGTGHSYTVHF